MSKIKNEFAFAFVSRGRLIVGKSLKGAISTKSLASAGLIDTAVMLLAIIVKVQITLTETLRPLRHCAGFS